MAYMTNKQFKTLGRIWTEIRDNDGKLSYDSFVEFSGLMREFQEDKDKHNNRTWNYIKNRRESDKSYCRPKNNMKIFEKTT